MRVSLYVEGGGHGKDLATQCRKAFSTVLTQAGLGGRMPRIVACGGRDDTYDSFRTALRSARADDFPMLLVDSEDPVSSDPWSHLQRRDRWVRPQSAQDDQAQLMVTCMESWVVADRAALRRTFGHLLRARSLPPLADLERRGKEEIQEGLKKATNGCGRHRRYEKGRRSFQVLSELDPNTLQARLPHFRRLVETLRARCGAGAVTDPGAG